MSKNSDDSEKSKHQVPAEYAQKIKWLFLVLADERLSAQAKVIAARLLHYHNDQSGRCDPRQSVLATATGMARQQVVRYVAELARRGWIATAKVDGGSLLYRLEVDRTEPLDIPLKAKRPQPFRTQPSQGLSDATDNWLSDTTDRGVSVTTDKGCPTPRTGVVRHDGHITFKEPQGNQESEPQLQPSLGRSGEVAPVIAANANTRDPEFETVRGIPIPVRLLAEWSDSFRSIHVRNEVRGLAGWIVEKGIEGDRRLTILEGKLSQKDREAREREQEMRIKAQAEAEANVKHKVRASRPAI